MGKRARNPFGAMRMMSIGRLIEELEKKPKNKSIQFATGREIRLATVSALLAPRHSS
jgi:hypothetical protein